LELTAEAINAVGEMLASMAQVPEQFRRSK
jgi:hypothetical protein